MITNLDYDSIIVLPNSYDPDSGAPIEFYIESANYLDGTPLTIKELDNLECVLTFKEWETLTCDYQK